MISGLAALNKMNRPAIGDDMRHPQQNRPSNTPQNNGSQMIPAFMPGQENMLADQLNMGFGGGMGQWQNYLDRVYGPTKIGPLHPGKGGDLRPNQPKVKPNTDLTNPNVTTVTSQHYPGDYVTGIVALRGRT